MKFTSLQVTYCKMKYHCILSSLCFVLHVHERTLLYNEVEHEADEDGAFIFWVCPCWYVCYSTPHPDRPGHSISDTIPSPSGSFTSATEIPFITTPVPSGRSYCVLHVFVLIFKEISQDMMLEFTYKFLCWSWFDSNLLRHFLIATFK